MRLKYSVQRSPYPIVMEVSNVEVEEEKDSKDTVSLLFDDVYENGGWVLLQHIAIWDARRLQNQIFHDGYLDITSYADVEEIEMLSSEYEED